MKKIALLSVLLLAFSGLFAQSSKSWSSLETKKLKLVKYCRGENVDGEIEKTGKMQNGDWLEYFYLWSDGNFIWEKMSGAQRYRGEYDGNTLDLEGRYGARELKWIQVERRDDDRVMLWCSDGIIRFCKIVTADDNFKHLVGKKLKIDMMCEGDFDEHDHIVRTSDISRQNSDSYFYVKSSSRVDIIMDGETVAKYEGYISSDNNSIFKIDEVIDGRSVKFFQVLDRADDKYTIWCSDSKIRFCRVVDSGNDDDDDDNDDDDDFGW